MSRATELDDLRTSFGFDAVTEEVRAARVVALFDRIAPRYDLMNDLMSFGLHRLWKAVLVRRAVARMGAAEGRVIDLAGGTGDIALALAARLPGREVVVVDPSEGMLAEARRRGGGAIGYVRAPAESLPFADASAVLVTLSFGLRNMADPARGLAEAVRVLRPGGHLALLEFSQPAAWFAPLYRLHARHVIPRIGAAVARDRAAYRYLVESIERFPAREDMARALAAAGLDLVAERAFVFGVARLQIGRKP
jgi:demethylmenaquinone methyltransferase/2-methoxy-6-polyprenyl-1,4-benzoquinol methylase